MTVSPTLNEEFSQFGHWWLPGENKNRWAGTVTFKPLSGIFLQLFKYQNCPKSARIIYGEIYEPPYEIMLLNVVWDSKRSTVNRIALSENPRYQAEYLLAGHWFFSPYEIDLKLHEVDVTFSNLRGWIWSGPTFSDDTGEEDTTLTYRRVHRVWKIPVSSAEAKFILQESNFPSWDDAQFRLDRTSFVRIVPDSPQPLGWFREQVDNLRGLFSFLTGMPVESKGATGSLTTSGNTREQVEIYYKSSPPTLDDVSNLDMPFPIERLGDQMDVVFQQWFEKREKLRVPFNLCLGIIFGGHQFPEFEFLTLIQALECYYQIVHPDVNNPSLQLCLTSLHRSLPVSLRKELSISKPIQETVVEARNYYTHRNPSKLEKALEGTELYDINSRLIHFSVALLSRELCIPDGVIQEVLQDAKLNAMWQRSRFQSALDPNIELLTEKPRT